FPGVRHPVNDSDKAKMRIAKASGSCLTVCIWTFLSIFMLFQHHVASANEVTVIQSYNVKPYNDALKGFKKNCNCDVDRFIVSEITETDILRSIRKSEPDIVVAIGADALKKVRVIKTIPIVYLMILNPQSMVSGRTNIRGVSLNIAPRKQLRILRKAIPGLKTVGLIYNPDSTGYFVKKALAAADASGIELFTKEIHNSKELPAVLKTMRGNVDAFWMLPDLTVVTTETIEFLFLFFLENRVPVITFSDKYLEMGALISLDIDAFDVGRQAGEITRKILSGTSIEAFSNMDARNAVITINQTIADKLGIRLNEEILEKANVINCK
ncbi:MAG: ABC transporter substrate binding protein, partial [Nitrospirota bacterium]|nr:ABC transporter substrate binding protein [Nitrospirota bacterium]